MLPRHAAIDCPRRRRYACAKRYERHAAAQRKDHALPEARGSAVTGARQRLRDKRRGAEMTAARVRAARCYELRQYAALFRYGDFALLRRFRFYFRRRHAPRRSRHDFLPLLLMPPITPRHACQVNRIAATLDCFTPGRCWHADDWHTPPADAALQRLPPYTRYMLSCCC